MRTAPPPPPAALQPVAPQPAPPARAPKVLLIPKIVTSARVPDGAGLELVEPVPTIARARAGHGIASRSLKRSSKTHHALGRASGSQRATAATPVEAQALEGSGKRRRGVDRGALIRKARGAGPPVGVLVALPIVLVFGLALLLLGGGSATPPASATPAARTATPAATPAPPRSSPAAPPLPEVGSASATDAAPQDEPARPRPRGNPLEAGEDAPSPADAALFRQRERELYEAERRMIEEQQRKADAAPAADAPAADAPAADAPAADAPAADDE